MRFPSICAFFALTALLSVCASVLPAEESARASCFTLSSAAKSNLTPVAVGDTTMYYDPAQPILTLADFTVDTLKKTPTQYVINIVPTAKATAKLNALQGSGSDSLTLYFILDDLATPIVLDSAINADTGIVIPMTVSADKGDHMVKRLKRAAAAAK